nr:hypothetical protein [Tanacetum cinerariifolium]
MSGHRYSRILKVDPVGDCGYLKPEGNSSGTSFFVVQTNAAFDFSSFSGSSVSVDYLVRRDSHAGGYELYDIRLVSGGAGDNMIEKGSGSFSASDCVSDVAHSGGGCDRTADHSSCYRCGGNHKARECLIGNNCGGGGSGCYNCGEGHHYARNCPTGNSRRGGICYTSGEVGHFFVRDCHDNNRGSGCSSCGQSSHATSNCHKRRHM